MLLKQIVRQLDAELDRLERLRTIVAGLQSSLILVPLVLPEAATPAVPDESFGALGDTTSDFESVPEPEAAVVPQRRTRKAAPISRAKLPRVQHVASSLAKTLTSTIPAGPVVISPEALARERQSRLPAQSKAATQHTTEVAKSEPLLETGKTSDALVRHLTQRWLSGAASA